MSAMARPARVDPCYALTARRHARRVSRLYDRHLASTRLSSSQHSILAVLEAHGRLKITELADRLVMERTSLVRALKPLQAAGLVIAERSEQGRSFDVRLTPRGVKESRRVDAALEKGTGRLRA
jgi:DNA-binding MarR family transcriptional regulator